DAQSVLVGLADGSLKQIKVADGKEMKALPTPQKAALVSLAYAPKGDIVFAASDKTIVAAALPDGAVKLKFEHVGPISAMTMSKDGARLAALADKTIKVWNAADGKEVGTLKLIADAKEISLSPDGTRVLVGGADKFARVFDVTGQLLETLPHDGPVQGVAYV